MSRVLEQNKRQSRQLELQHESAIGEIQAECEDRIFPMLSHAAAPAEAAGACFVPTPCSYMLQASEHDRAMRQLVREFTAVTLRL